MIESETIILNEIQLIKRLTRKNSQFADIID